MVVQIPGRLWHVGDNIDTDTLFPGRFMTIRSADKDGALRGLGVCYPELAADLTKGDGLVAGQNFGCGSSREYAATALRDLGITIVVARSFARIFYRNAISIGLPVLECDEATLLPENGPLTINLRTGEIVYPNSGQRFWGKPIPEFLLEILKQGGLLQYVQRKIEEGEINKYRGKCL